MGNLFNCTFEFESVNIVGIFNIANIGLCDGAGKDVSSDDVSNVISKSRSTNNSDLVDTVYTSVRLIGNSYRCSNDELSFKVSKLSRN